MTQRILIIEDDASLGNNVLELFMEEGFDAAWASTGAEGIALAKGRTPDLVVCDILMPELDGFGVLSALREYPATARVPFIFLSSKAERADIREGMDRGADDYVSKPFELAELLNAARARLRRAGELSLRAGAAVERANVQSGLSNGAPFEPAQGIVVSDARMCRLYSELERAAQSNINVLLLGETGVGKEVVAQALHRLSPRHAAPFLALNCAALSESLLESELFGHERGAFTGALQARSGLFESAEGGTVFLDEIGDLPATIQSTLLRVLEERKVRRVGARVPRNIDVRFVSATNKSLEAEMARGTFRNDLYYRINGMRLTVPPLRERREEIAALARVFLARACAEQGRTWTLELAPEALAALESYSWPGNIRELKNEIERAVVLAEGHTLLVGHFSPALALPAAPSSAPATDTLARLKDEHREIKRKRVVEALEVSGGNQTLAAQQLGVSRRALIYWLRDLGLTPSRKRD